MAKGDSRLPLPQAGKDAKCAKGDSRKDAKCAKGDSRLPLPQAGKDAKCAKGDSHKDAKCAKGDSRKDAKCAKEIHTKTQSAQRRFTQRRKVRKGDSRKDAKCAKEIHVKTQSAQREIHACLCRRQAKTQSAQDYCVFRKGVKQIAGSIFGGLNLRVQPD